MPNRTDDPDKPGLRERKKARTRASIQSHALRLFTEQGYEATTIDQIIDAAEVSESTFFRYFPTKESVVLFDEFDPRIVAAYDAQPEESSPIAAMRAAMREALNELTDAQKQEQRERLPLLLGVPALRAAMLDQLSQGMLLLSEAIAHRSGRPSDDFQVRTIAGAIVGCMFAVLGRLMDEPGADMFELIDEAFGYLENGLEL
ncbi:TetR family transcriptional regulator [Humibacter antri]